MSQCRRCRSRLEQFLDRELGSSDSQAVERHLTGCADCRRELAALQSLQQLVRSAPVVERPAGYWDRLDRRLQAAVRVGARPSAARAGSGIRLLVPRILAVAGAFVILVGVGMVGLRRARDWNRSALRQTSAALPADTARVRPDAIAEQKSAGSGQVRRSARVEPTEPVEDAGEPSPVAEAPTTHMPATATGMTGGAGKTTASAPKRELAGRPSIKSAAENRPGAMPPAPPVAAAGSGPKKAAERILAPSVPAEIKDESDTRLDAARAKTAEIAQDSTIYFDDQVDTRPVLQSLPAPDSDLRRRFPNMAVPVWVLVERNGTVSRAEVRVSLALDGLAEAVVPLARQARFAPGRLGGAAVRVGTTITVRIPADGGRRK